MQSGNKSVAGRKDPWKELELAYSWADLVLPEAQREALLSVVAELHRRDAASEKGGKRAGGRKPGLAVLFAGAPGTGKTMAAQILGGALGRVVLHVDLTSAFAGDARKARQTADRLFATAASAGAILFFDHADALLGSRPRAMRLRERTAAIDAAELIELSEAYPGLVVFASNLMRRIDDAFVKRFAFAIDFPFPDSDARRELWARLLPFDARVSKTEIDFLAKSFKLPGATIRSCCLAAAEDARREGVPVNIVHLAEAVEREYRDRPVSESTREALDQLLTATQSEAVESSDANVAATMPARPSPWSSISAGRRSAALVLSGTVAAAALGFVVARASGGGSSLAALDRHISVGAVQVSFPGGWRRQAPPTSPPLGLTGELALAPAASGDGLLVLGRTTATGQQLVPQSLLAVVSSAATPQIVPLGGLRFYRYRDSAKGSAATADSLYALPTTVGTIVGVCMPRQAPGAFTSTCERLLATIKLTSGSVIALGPSAGYASALSGLVSRLNAVRSSAGSQLRAARNSRDQANAANRLAAAHADAAAALLRLQTGPSPVNTSVAAALRMNADAYGALGRAAAHSDARGYNAASTSVTRATAALDSAFVQLSRLGYRVG